MQDAMDNQNNIANQELHLYIWNRKKENFFVRDIKVFKRFGNPQRYSLLYK